MLSAAAQAISIAFFGAVFITVAFQLLSGSIKTAGLLNDKETRTFSPGRLQLLLVTISGAAFYFTKILATVDQSSLPPVPDELLLAVGASNAGYLGGKIHSRFFSPHMRDMA